MYRPKQGQLIWVAASICVVMIVVHSFTQSMGAWLSWMTGVSLSVVVVCSGAIAWVAPGATLKKTPSAASGRTRCCSMVSSSPSRSLWRSYTG